ncbi:MAG: sugar transferase [Desulfobulbaceae bacterium]|nr:sugar transferase [Desulfobulbaceae bacterium]
MTPLMSWNLRERSSLIYRFLHLLDCCLACFLLWALTTLYDVIWSTYYTRLLVVVFVLCFCLFHNFQLYRSWRGWKYYKELFVILRAWAAVVAALLAYFFLFKISEAYSRAVIIVWSLTTPFILFMAHLAVRRVLRHYRARGKNIRHAVIVGAGDLGLRTAQRIEDVPWAGIVVAGFFDDKVELGASLQALGKPLLGRTDDVEGYLRQHELDYVYIALPLRAERKIFKILKDCRDLGAQLYLVPDIYVFGLHHAEIQSLGDLLVLNFNPDLEWKRSFDVCFSLAVLILLFPIYLLIALAIKLDSPGPVLFRHKRIMATGRPFYCLKFRTMEVDAEKRLQELLAADTDKRAEWERHYKLKDDPRITRIGRFLRRTSLDELPQFVNVLKGEMSVVGARPIVGKELEDYYKTNDDHSAGRYCSMKPGITGLWQVMKRSDIVDYKERVELDDWYVLNVSLKTDIHIIIKTVSCMFNGKGAY